MRIEIAERLKPYQHKAGTQVLIPKTPIRATIYPALVCFHDLSQAEPKFLKEIPLLITGPVKDFTVQQDLEKGCIWVWGFSQEGYFRYTISPDLEIVFGKVAQTSTPETTRLSLGNHKAQDWCMVKRRLDLAEILPVWLRLGQLVPQFQVTEAGTGILLKQCKELVSQNKRLEIMPAFKSLFLAGFEGLLSPRLVDTEHQGFCLSNPEKKSSPLILLSEGAYLIQSLFIQSNQNRLSVLPVLPPEFHTGRLLHYHWKGYGFVAIEWSKKLIKKMILHCESTATVQIEFQRDVKSFRLNGVTKKSDENLELVAEKTYFFDHFTK